MEADTCQPRETYPPQVHIAQTYGYALLAVFQRIGRDGFYGTAGAVEVRSLAERLGLTPASHVLDLGAGVGGPACLVAQSYGCRVTGVDLSPFNCARARERAQQAGVSHLATFREGDYLTVPLPEQGFTHVFGCDAWSYVPDKRQLFRRAHHALQPGGVIAFYEGTTGRRNPTRERRSALGNPIYLEPLEAYVSQLQDVGFETLEARDTTAEVCTPFLSVVYAQMTQRDTIITTVGQEAYWRILEATAWIGLGLQQGQMGHCCIIAHRRT